MKQKIKAFVVAIVLFSICAPAQGVLDTKQCLSRNEAVRRSLDPEIARGFIWTETGNGQTQPWMNEMKRLGVRQANVEVQFRLFKNAIELELGEIDLYNEYRTFDRALLIKAGPEKTDLQDLKSQLRFAFFADSIRLLNATKIPDNYRGRLFLSLLDDACLAMPVIMPSTELIAPKS